MSVDAVFCAGNVAVITGSSSGIGRAAARMCARVGMKVALADIDEANLSEAVEEVKALAADAAMVVGVRTDVGDVLSVQALQEAVISQLGPVNFLMNNAGIGTGGGALAGLEKWQRTLQVNTWGVINGCQVFVPGMIESALPGMIVNTGSKQGITMPPGNLAYNVSKAAVKAYTEGLQHELREGKSPLTAHLLVPGWVNTSIALKAKRDEALAAGEDFTADSVFFHEGKPAAGAWMPDQVVEFLLAELQKQRFYIICPDNDVDRETDNLRMEWTMGDITKDRPPLSRWHPDYKDAFSTYLAENKASQQ